MTAPALELTGISKRFGPTVALDGAALEVRDGEVRALVGENGAGKSTLMAIVAGALAPDAGTMRVGGAPYRPRTPRDARRAGIALVHQELSLFPHLSVWENVLAGLEAHHGGWLDGRVNRARTQDALSWLGHADIDPDRPVRELSIAARQVVEISRALVTSARLVLLDEPTSSLHREDVERLFAVVRRLASRGVSVVYISHALEEVRQIASRVTVLRDGRTVATLPVADTSDAEIVARMVGRNVERFFPARRARECDGVAMEVRGLSAPPAVHEASFELHRGEILGIAGLVGAGRSTLVRALFGLVRARGGSVRLPSAGPLDASRTPAERIRAGLGYVSEDRKEEGLALAMSTADNVTMTDLRQCARFGWIDLGAQAARARELVARVRARVHHPSQPVRTLSGGNQQKVALARVLHQDARILLLDEPTRGIDVASKAQVYELVAALADDGCAVLLVSSYLPELFGLCDRLAVMRRGRLLPARPIDEWTEHGVLEQALGLGADAARGLPA